ncbi:MAG: carbohydrate ABC transporter permease [Planctomycetes bacterium]|nr:carbohydrate ABC transporter permease [Planctomycetota bacterium]
MTVDTSMSEIAPARRWRKLPGSAAPHRGRQGPWLAAAAGNIVVSILILLGICITVAPFLLSLYLALLPYTASILPYRLNPAEWTHANFVAAWTTAHVAEYGLNSLFYAVTNALLTTLLATTAGYVFERMHFPFKNGLWYLILAGMMVPGMVTLAPRLALMIHFPLVGGNNILGVGGKGFYDSWLGVILPSIVSPTSTFLMRQFFQSLPNELEDAARVDGSSEIGIFVRIMLPLATPGVVTTFMLQFQGAWNELLWPQMITVSQSMRTLAVGLTYLSQVIGYGASAAGIPMNYAQAGAIMMALPIIVLFIVGQRWFVRGIALTGLK